jgi:hypothetical protein
MTETFSRIVRSVTALLLGAAMLVVPPAVTPVSAAGCQFVLGFAVMQGLIPSVVGSCLDNESHGANGDALQHTTGGLLVWRKCDNFTAFTDGYRTWVNGPNGLQTRLNTERFPWEHDQCGSGTVAAPANAASNLESNPALWTASQCQLGNNRTDCSLIFFDPPSTVSSPTSDGSAMRLDVNGGPPFSSVQWQRSLSGVSALPTARTYTYDVDFYYTPPTTFNNVDGASQFQSIDFGFQVGRTEPVDGNYRLYQAGLQFDVVRNGGKLGLPPIWQVLDNTNANNFGYNNWAATSANAYLAANQWHHLRFAVAVEPLHPECQGFAARYQSLTVDGQSYPLSTATCAFFPTGQSSPQASATLELDGTSPTSPFTLLVRNVSVSWSG